MSAAIYRCGNEWCSFAPRGVFRRSGDVRTFVGECGCPIRPRTEFLEGDKPDGSPRCDESTWEAEGHGVLAFAPTEQGAIALWRRKLEDAQREEDALHEQLIAKNEAAKAAKAAAPAVTAPAPPPAVVSADGPCADCGGGCFVQTTPHKQQCTTCGRVRTIAASAPRVVRTIAASAPRVP